VEVICTTDDPIDDLRHHQQLAKDQNLGFRVLPAFRPDKALKAGQQGFGDYIGKLSQVSGVAIQSTADVIKALDKRIQYFHDNGARVSDHGLDTVPFVEPDRTLADKALQDGMAGKSVDPLHLEHYQTAVLVALGKSYHDRGWAQQYHMNAIRNNNTRLFKAFGPDTGVDSITDTPVAEKLLALMDAQDVAGHLPKTILYSLNPAANYILATAAGCFQGGTPGKVQFGSAWWFLDQLDGMRDQMRTLASVGLISNFIGMLTDSRSMISIPGMITSAALSAT
jgi:glucuronate isomerase